MRHEGSEFGGRVGHQTESDAADRSWDTELVPGLQGRTARPEATCPVEVALAAVSGRWTTLLLRELMHGPLSFGELRERLPEISPKVLAERLRTLEERGLAGCERLRGFPVRTSYRLTATGRALRPLLVELYRTGTAIGTPGPR
ncbi:transcriptional regulator [Streptomyces sp. CB01881]|uniref:winged helix-turn-helix transcriptional regulator n=1 Tax=Streptomyces sp. CB01881 TaxID=2078691 RepID=UPI0011DF06A0|nr:helix-turn-helix domain-containing protein [Streptomyces sp. CB01881]TYC68151.1 transcriptional regulator [Streptomyces sp. CB01881]